MTIPDQKKLLIDNAIEEIKNICINLQKDLEDKQVMADIDDMYYHHFSEVNKSDER
tara:strand:- start:3016 stop:3183 length:168 start_codon:yes stop_codon:yes gene_type:complete